MSDILQKICAVKVEEVAAAAAARVLGAGRYAVGAQLAGRMALLGHRSRSEANGMVAPSRNGIEVPRW